MQTALHIAALVAQLKREIVGGKLVATEFYKKQRSAYFFIKKERSKSALGFVYHPAGSGCFCVPASKVRLDTNEKPWPVFGLDGAAIISVDQPSLDRVFYLNLKCDGNPKRVVFEVLGPNGNLWLLDDRDRKEATLRNRKFSAGDEYLPLSPGDRVNPHQIEGGQIADQLASEPGRSCVAVLKSMLLGFNDTLIREALNRAGLKTADLRSPSGDPGDKLAAAIRDIAGRFSRADVGYQYLVKGVTEVYPFKLASVDAQPEKAKTLSLATMDMIAERRDSRSEDDEEKRVLKAVTRVIKRQEKLVRNLEKDIERASEYPKYKRFAELLQLNRSRLKKGIRSIAVDDVLAESPGEVTIELDPALGVNENIDEYFRRHRKGREGIDLLRRRLEIVSEEVKAWATIQADLETDFESARQRYESEILSSQPRAANKNGTPVRLPYRAATLSTGLTIFIGRDGTDNDRTTFEFARPYELWFHTQQCPGSHVVMKYPNKSFKPSKREIDETAAIAAYHSKAKHDSLVPVIYTHRKYVRKPRKAKPGLVMVDHEKSVMVEPRKESKSG